MDVFDDWETFFAAVDEMNDWERKSGSRMDVSDDWEIKTDVLHDWATFSVSQSSETSILISQSSKTSIRGPDMHSQSSISSTTTPFVLPIVENVHGPGWTWLGVSTARADRAGPGRVPPVGVPGPSRRGPQRALQATDCESWRPVLGDGLVNDGRLWGRTRMPSRR